MLTRVLLFLYFIIVLTSCSSHYIPKTGDIVFQDLDCGDLCNAIEKVTTGVKGTHLSHVGIISVENDTAFVYEAIGPGVIRTPFLKFLDRSRDSAHHPKVLVGRLDKKYDYSIPAAVQFSKTLLNKPYDSVFDLTNDSYYCSELVYFAFKDSAQKNLFEVSPMTFKDPATGNIFPAWKEYYKDLNAKIPEGKPGLNPGGISRSPLIHIVYKFY